MEGRHILCDYCRAPTEFVSDAAVYAHSYGKMIYLCRPCGAYVGVHDGTNQPLGRLADKELRAWKIKAHAAFDPLWEAKLKSKRSSKKKYRKGHARNAGYKWLAEQMGLTREECHIGMFSVEQCQRVVAICAPYRQKLLKVE